ncbi:MAG: hopanoid biosynthesis protein HpnM [Gammaproteobacteria bacterium]|nr:hopanoid biosynthesis protein HpnM [Gammaproteobacteria bacterium]
MLNNTFIKRWVLLCLCVAATSVLAVEKSASPAKKIVDTFQDELINVMKNGKKLGFSGRYDKLKAPVENSHDLNKIARIVVGKEWEKLSETQQQQLVDVFSRLSVASYAHNFNDYSGENFTFDNEGETKLGNAVIHYHLNIPDDKPVKFEYMLKDNGGNWRIINIIANGVSDLALKRSDYTSILQREGFDALIAKINEKIENYSKK